MMILFFRRITSAYLDKIGYKWLRLKMDWTLCKSLETQRQI